MLDSEQKIPIEILRSHIDTKNGLGMLARVAAKIYESLGYDFPPSYPVKRAIEDGHIIVVEDTGLPPDEREIPRGYR